jgi:hypothetical protein
MMLYSKGNESGACSDADRGAQAVRKEVDVMYTYEVLSAENEAFAGTGGISSNNREARFVPAFREDRSGRVEVARHENGQPAAMHLLCCLPEEWVTGRDEKGRIVAVLDSVEAGFLRDGVFFTRAEAARLA